MVSGPVLGIEQFFRLKEHAFTEPHVFAEFSKRSDATFIGGDHDAPQQGPALGQLGYVISNRFVAWGQLLAKLDQHVTH